MSKTKPQQGKMLTAADIRSYGVCKTHRAWVLLCCSNLAELRKDENNHSRWYWK